ncbi:MAG: XrtA/PEP-CTERM system TPR-repeat protein PrsT [Burkholderiales bacterium]
MIDIRTKRLPLAVAFLAASLLVACSGGGTDALLASARDKLDKGDARSAAIEAKNALQKNPELAEARYLLGRALLESGDLAGAEVELVKARELRFTGDQLVPALAQVYLAQGKLDKVVELANGPALVSPAAIAEFNTQIAAAELIRGKRREATEAIVAALTAKADHAPAKLLQARLLAADRNFEGALSIVDSVIASTPQDANALRLKGDLHGAQGNVDPAIEAYRKAVAARPASVAGHVSLVQALLRQRKNEDAHKAFEALKKAAPTHPQTLYFEAQLAILRKDFKVAKEASQQLLRMTPNNPAALVQAGIVDLNLRSFVQAEASLMKALQVAPEATVARRWLASAQLAQGQAAKAVATLQPALAKPDVDPGLLMVAGQAYMQSGDPKRAEELLARAAKAEPSDPRKRTALAMVRMGRGDADAAMADLEQVASSDSGATADLALIASSLRRGEFDRALKAIDALAKKQPDQPLPHDLRGRALMGKKDAAGARASFERALSISPGYFQAAAALAALDVADKRPADAITRFEKLTTADPTNARGFLALAELKAGQKAPADEVANLIGKAISAAPADLEARAAQVGFHLRAKETNKAVLAAQNAVAALPNRPEALELLGRAQAAAGDHNQALLTFGKMAAAMPASADPHLRMAEVHMAAKNSGAAAQSLRKAIELRPDLLAAQRGLAMIELSAGKPQNALEIARQLQKQKPGDAAGYLLEGDIHASRRAWPEAGDALRRGLKQSPSTEIAVKLHSVLLTGGKTAEASQVAGAWLKERPRDVAFRMHLGDVASARKEYAQAVTSYRSVLEIQPENAIVLNNLAWALGKQGSAEALPTAEKAHRLMPDQPAIMDTLGVIAAEGGDVKRGLDLLAKALKAAPQASGIRLNYARVLIKAGQKADARRELEELGKLGEKFDGRAEVEALMRTL